MNGQQRKKIKKMSDKEFKKIQYMTLKKMQKEHPELNVTMKDLENLRQVYLDLDEIERDFNNMDYGEDIY